MQFDQSSTVHPVSESRGGPLSEGQRTDILVSNTGLNLVSFLPINNILTSHSSVNLLDIIILVLSLKGSQAELAFWSAMVRKALVREVDAEHQSVKLASAR